MSAPPAQAPPDRGLICSSPVQEEPTTRVEWSVKELDALLCCGASDSASPLTGPGGSFYPTPSFTPLMVHDDLTPLANKDQAFGANEVVGEAVPCAFGHTLLAIRGVAPFRFVNLVRGAPRKVRSFDAIRDEIKSAAKLRHANVLGTIDAQVIGRAEAITEYSRGQTLDTLLATKRVSLGLLLRILVDTLRGVDALHRSACDGTGVRVHRDVRPRNIVVGRDGTSRISGFRLRDVFDTSADAQAQIEMTSYSSPEQLIGERLDATADLFSIGVILWEGVSNKPLFRADTLTATMYTVAAQSAPRLIDSVPGTPTDLSRLCSQLLAKTQSERPRSALAVARELLIVADRFGAVASHAEVACLVSQFDQDPCPTSEAPQPTPSSPPMPPSATPLRATLKQSVAKFDVSPNGKHSLGLFCLALALCGLTTLMLALGIGRTADSFCGATIRDSNELGGTNTPSISRPLAPQE
jgi:serine/threonine protein kinase